MSSAAARRQALPASGGGIAKAAPVGMDRTPRRRFLVRAGCVLAGAAGFVEGAARAARADATTLPSCAPIDEMMAEFMRRHKPPGAALAITRRGKLAYARGFGYADVDRRAPVEPTSLFRIASLSKPITAAAVFHLVERGRLRLGDRVVDLLKIEPHLEKGAAVDRRLRDVTVRHCLQHTAGWDRERSFDPMSATTAEDVARALGTALPITPRHILRYTLGKPLDFAPGTAYAYSNFGYCVLGRVIEAAAGMPYDRFVAERILAPLGIRRMRLGRNLPADRAPAEVCYYDSGRRTGRAISGAHIGSQVPLPYGVECLETMDANGGWIASAVDLARFAVAWDDPKHCPLLKESSVREMLAPPPPPVSRTRSGGLADRYYACGWNVRPAPDGGDRCTKYHTGLLAGTSTLLVCRRDGMDWAVLLNSDADARGKNFAARIDPLVHQAVDAVKTWPTDDLFSRF